LSFFSFLFFLSFSFFFLSFSFFFSSHTIYIMMNNHISGTQPESQRPPPEDSTFPVLFPLLACEARRKKKPRQNGKPSDGLPLPKKEKEKNSACPWGGWGPPGGVVWSLDRTRDQPLFFFVPKPKCAGFVLGRGDACRVGTSLPGPSLFLWSPFRAEGPRKLRGSAPPAIRHYTCRAASNARCLPLAPLFLRPFPLSLSAAIRAAGLGCPGPSLLRVSLWKRRGRASQRMVHGFHFEPRAAVPLRRFVSDPPRLIALRASLDPEGVLATRLAISWVRRKPGKKKSISVGEARSVPWFILDVWVGGR